MARTERSFQDLTASSNISLLTLFPNLLLCYTSWAVVVRGADHRAVHAECWAGSSEGGCRPSGTACRECKVAEGGKPASQAAPSPRQKEAAQHHPRAEIFAIMKG
eukprot:1164923-Amphidinium_carterae.1